jgi:hypothetical protein
MTRVVHLFPDTNVLVQCRPLEQLDWSAWRQVDEVCLIMSRPVQSEIDSHKNKGGDRLARRARKASTLLRGIIIGGHGHLLVRTADPIVKLFINTAVRPSQDLAGVLDYSHPDDQLVGIVHAFAQQNPGVDARLLTSDTGPMASALMVGVAIAPVPDDWLLPPESSESDKRIRSLEAEVARLKESEPKFSIACIDANGSELERLELEVAHYEPLSPAELSSLLGKLTQRFPLVTDFGPRECQERLTHGPMRIMGAKEVFTPATEKEIDEYHKKRKEWLNQCDAKLRNLHDELEAREGPLAFAFRASNDGTRPASDALVTLRAKGQFKITPPPCRPSDDGDDDDDDDDEQPGDQAHQPVTLPSPPAVPRGSWATLYASQLTEFGVLASQLSAFDRLKEFHETFKLATAVPILDDHMLRGISPLKPRDPNGFYYKPDRPSSPRQEFSVECQQWRHGMEPEVFVGQIYLDSDAGETSGALECHVHAGNLSQSVAKLVPVRIRICRRTVLEIAEVMIEGLEEIIERLA